MGQLEYYSKEINDIIRSDLIMIYGAGTMGRNLLKCLTDPPYDLKIENIIVRSMSDNDSIVDDVEVIDIEHALCYKDALVLVALNGKLISEAVCDLKSAGFNNIIPISFDGDEWTTIRSNWIRANDLLPGVRFLSDIDNSVNTADKDIDDLNLSDRLRIYVVHSVYDRELADKPVDTVYDVPIQVGAALTDRHIFETLDSDGIDNISGKNRQYCELTGIYWAWKNDDSDYIGFCHYRRRFDLTNDQISYIAGGNADIVVTWPILNFDTVRKQYGKDHIIEDWDTLMDVIEDIAPDYHAAACEVQNGIYYYAYNMFIMKKDLFDDYCNFIFPILEECERRIGQKDDIYQNRYIGFLAERLLSVYLTKNRHLKVAIAEKTFYE